MDLLKRLIKHDLISGSFYIFAGSMFANVMAFLLNLFLARNLSYSDYAIFASLLSVITLISIPANSLNTIVAKFATKFHVREENEKLKALYVFFFKIVLTICTIIILVFTVFTAQIGEFLHISNYLYLLLTGLIISSFYLNGLNSAILQSLLKFNFLSFLTAAGGLLKLISGVFLVILGYKAFGGLWSVLIMTFGMYLIAYIQLVRILKYKSNNKKISINPKEIFRYAIPSFLAVISITSFTSTDVILVKHFFDAHQAGFYAGLSLIGKVIFYFTFPIPMVMFPLLIKRHTTGKRFLNLFYLSLILVAIPSILISALYFLRPELIINLFLGGREYLSISKYLGIFGIYLSVFSIVNVFVSFFLSLNITKVFIPVAFSALSQIILISIYHSDFYQIIYISLCVSLVLLVFLILLFLRQKWNLIELKEKSLPVNPL